MPRYLKGIGGKIVNACLRLWGEEKKVIALLQSLDLGPDDKILDVGCGLGRYTRVLTSFGLNVTGIDINDVAVKTCRAEGLPCMTIAEHAKKDSTYRLILMSHVIEHLPPWELLPFMERYLDRLQEGGYLVIATPLPTKRFYNGFDHVKPYLPGAISTVFCEEGVEVQYRSRNRLELMDVWFRRRPFLRWIEPALSYKRNPILSLSNVFWGLLFALSFGLIGERDVWGGLFKKIGQNLPSGLNK